MQYKLFLDDYRIVLDAFIYKHHLIYKEPDWVIVRSYDEFCKCIKTNGLPEVVSFDHDLADIHYNIENQNGEIDYDNFTEKTGYHCAKWMIDYMLDNNIFELPYCLVHSMNPVGSENIALLFKSYLKQQSKLK